MLTLAQDHISLARKECAFYKDQCAKSKTEIEKHFSQSDGSLCLTVPLYDIPASRDSPYTLVSIIPSMTINIPILELTSLLPKDPLPQ